MYFCWYLSAALSSVIRTLKLGVNAMVAARILPWGPCSYRDLYCNKYLSWLLQVLLKFILTSILPQNY